MKKAIVLFAHGSRDPLWRKPMEAVADRIRATSTQANVACAYLELSTPDLPTVIKELLSTGVSSVSIVPMFLGIGKHAREDLPSLVEQLRTEYPDLTLHLTPAVGENPKLVHLLADIALDSLQ